MKKEYSKALRSLFDQFLRQHNIPLTDYKLPFEHRARGDRAYRYQKADLNILNTLSCFVILIIGKGNEFTMEIGWSESNSFPDVKVRPSGFLSQDRNEFKHSDFVFRIGDLLGKNDFWWTVEEIPRTLDDLMGSMGKITNDVAKKKIQPFVEDAIKKLNCNVFPFFEELTAYKLSRFK